MKKQSCFLSFFMLAQLSLVMAAPPSATLKKQADIGRISINTYTANANSSALKERRLQRIACGVAVNVLPLQLLDFNGQTQHAGNYLFWTTMHEVNAATFELQHSKDGAGFTPITKVTALNKGGTNKYGFLDSKYVFGTNYYRLKQIDKDGKYTLSPIVKLENKGKAVWAVSIYPNPVTDVANVVVNTTTPQAVQFSLFSAEGKMIWTRKQNLQAWQQSIYMSMKTLPAGTYRLMVQGQDGDKTSVAIIKQ